MTLNLSPNWNERPDGAVINTVIIHYTGMQTGQAALERLCNKESEVSAHYLIEENGIVHQLVNEEKRAWHAGVSHWRGCDNLNHNSIGIELVNPGHEFGYRAFPDMQIHILLGLLEEINERHPITKAGFIGHSDIAPMRKTDPGELFPWKLCWEHGFGLWSLEDGTNEEILLKLGDAGNQVQKLNELLKIIGYNITNCDVFDAETEMALRAFQAHWRQSKVSGIYDKGTKLILQDIAAQSEKYGKTQ